MEEFWGVPYFVWVIVCLTIATLYYFFAPKQSKNPTLSVMSRRILKYFHSLVWILLAIASLLANFKFNSMAKLIALLSLGVYLVFMITLVRAKTGEKKSG